MNEIVSGPTGKASGFAGHASTAAVHGHADGVDGAIYPAAGRPVELGVLSGCTAMPFPHLTPTLRC